MCLLMDLGLSGLIAVSVYLQVFELIKKTTLWMGEAPTFSKKPIPVWELDYSLFAAIIRCKESQDVSQILRKTG